MLRILEINAAFTWNLRQAFRLWRIHFRQNNILASGTKLISTVKKFQNFCASWIFRGNNSDAFAVYCAQCGNYGIILPQFFSQIFRQINSFFNFFGKTITSTKFLFFPEMGESKRSKRLIIKIVSTENPAGRKILKFLHCAHINLVPDAKILFWRKCIRQRRKACRKFHVKAALVSRMCNIAKRRRLNVIFQIQSRRSDFHNWQTIISVLIPFLNDDVLKEFFREIVGAVNFREKGSPLFCV